MRMVRQLAIGSCVLSVGVFAATLQQLSVEEMAQKSTQIVRGRVAGCTGEMRGSVIYTRCRVSVSEHWKGTAGAQAEFIVPGGTLGGYTQTFTGAPKFNGGQEYVFFLWAGRSGVNQIIGLSQGIFELQSDAKNGTLAKREASSEIMLARDGGVVQDTPVQLSVSELRTRVTKALGEAR